MSVEWYRSRPGTPYRALQWLGEENCAEVFEFIGVAHQAHGEDVFCKEIVLPGEGHIAEPGNWIIESRFFPGEFGAVDHDLFVEGMARYTETFPERTPLLSGIVGSTAYGLATPESDVDRLGIFAAPTIAFHGLTPPQGSHVTTQPDVTWHEAGKYASLALKANPSVLELLWLPEDLYEDVTPLGTALIDIRRDLLSAQAVRNAYFGYATQQVKRLKDYTAARPREDRIAKPHRPEKVAKHARHVARLLYQGLALYEMGNLPVRLDSGEADWVRRFGERVADHDETAADWLLKDFEGKFDIAAPALPETPRTDLAELWVREVRRAHYTEKG